MADETKPDLATMRQGILQRVFEILSPEALNKLHKSKPAFTEKPFGAKCVDLYHLIIDVLSDKYDDFELDADQQYIKEQATRYKFRQRELDLLSAPSPDIVPVSSPETITNNLQAQQLEKTLQAQQLAKTKKMPELSDLDFFPILDFNTKIVEALRPFPAASDTAKNGRIIAQIPPGPLAEFSNYATEELRSQNHVIVHDNILDSMADSADFLIPPALKILKPEFNSEPKTIAQVAPDSLAPLALSLTVADPMIISTDAGPLLAFYVYAATCATTSGHINPGRRRRNLPGSLFSPAALSPPPVPGSSSPPAPRLSLSQRRSLSPTKPWKASRFRRRHRTHLPLLRGKPRKTSRFRRRCSGARSVSP